MRDVPCTAGNHLDGRPLQAMPCKVQDADRHAPVHNDRAREIRIAYDPISPGAREQTQIEADAGTTRRCPHLQQRDGELVSIFPHAGPLAQRRTVIDQDAHLCKSFRVSILL